MDVAVSVFRAVLSVIAWVWESRGLLRIGALGATFALALSNLYFLRRVERYRPSGGGAADGGHTVGVDSRGGNADGNGADGDLPWVSVLVPARNEERNIEACARSLLEQDYPRFEVLVLDDDSTDETPAILDRIAQTDARLRVLRGRPLPDGWLGKHWACHQLALASNGELLLFTDADTRHHPCMLRDAVAAQQKEGSDLLTGLPREEAVSWGEILVIPVIGWAVLALLPLGPAHRLRSPLLCMGIGQFMLFRRSAYRAVGGFEAVRADPVDDMALAKRIKSQGFRWRFVDLSSRVTCRMYRGFRGVSDGLGKSVFPALGNRVWVLAVLLVVLTWLYLGPIAAWTAWLLGLSSAGGPPFWAGAAVCLTLAVWSMVMWRFGQPLYRAFFYPLTIALILGIAVRSAVLFWRGQARWKDRTLPGLTRGASSGEDWSAD